LRNKAVDILIDILKFPKKRLRALAAMELGRIGRGAQRAVIPLITAIKDESGGVRRNAAKALGKIKDERSVLPLIEALRDHDSSVRAAASTSLGLLKDERAVEPLIRVINDTDYQVRINSIKVLGWFKDRRAIEPLAGVLEDETADAAIRFYAIDALGNIAITYGHLKGDPSVKALNDALNNEHEYVRKQAKNILSRLSVK